MIYYWGVFALLAFLAIHNVRYAVAFYAKNKKFSMMIFYLVLLTGLVGTIMHSTGRVMDVLDLRFKGATELVSDNNNG